MLSVVMPHLAAAEVADGVPLGQFSVATGGWLLFAAVSILVIRSIVAGKLVPRASLDDARQNLNDAIHDRDEWRAESRVKDAQLAEKDSQLQHLAEVGETEKAVLNALSKLTEEFKK